MAVDYKLLIDNTLKYVSSSSGIPKMN